MNYQIIAPKVGELSQQFRVVKMDTEETLYSSVHLSNCEQVVSALDNRQITEEMTKIIVYYNDTISLLCLSFETAAEHILKANGIDPSNVVEIVRELTNPTIDWDKWRIVEEDDLGIILNQYTEETY